MSRLEPWTTGVGQKLMVHNRLDCKPPCPIHMPSDHHMLYWPTVWFDLRSEVGIAATLRVCPHGRIHPDPDDMSYGVMMAGHPMSCDGCCMEGEL